jgi:hypothetical protein
MQQTLFPERDESDSENKVSSLGRGLTIHFIKPRSEARLFRNGVFIKTVDLSDKTARRLFVVDTVELGVTKALLATALGISRQTIHNYIEMQKNFGREGLINSYHAANSKRRTCGLAWTGRRETSTRDCAYAILNRCDASENTFKHLAVRQISAGYRNHLQHSFGSLLNEVAF